MNPFSTPNPFSPAEEIQRSPLEVENMLKESALLIDVREPDEFDETRIAGATLLPMSEISDRWQEIPRDKTVVLYCRSGDRSGQIAGALRMRAGYDNVYNLVGGILEWISLGLPVDSRPLQQTYSQTSYEEIDVREAWRRFDRLSHTLIDVREADEFASGHPVGAINIPLSELDDEINRLGDSGPLLLICNSGNRSGMAAEWLIDEGIVQVSNVEGGVIAWQQQRLPWKPGQVS